MTRIPSVPPQDPEGLRLSTSSFGVAELISVLRTMTRRDHENTHTFDNNGGIPCSACHGRGFIPPPPNTVLDPDEDASPTAGWSIPISAAPVSLEPLGVIAQDNNDSAANATNITIAAVDLVSATTDGIIIGGSNTVGTTNVNADTAHTTMDNTAAIGSNTLVADNVQVTELATAANNLPAAPSSNADTTNHTANLATSANGNSAVTITSADRINADRITAVDPPSDNNTTNFPPPLPVGSASPSVAQRSGRWYCVSRGRQVGVFHSWPSTAPNVVGVSGACYVRYSSHALAREAFNAALENGDVATML